MSMSKRVAKIGEYVPPVRAKVGDVIKDKLGGTMFEVGAVDAEKVYSRGLGLMIPHGNYEVVELGEPKVHPGTIKNPEGLKKALSEVPELGDADGADLISRNAVLSDVMEKFVTQTEKGVRKYGNTVNPEEYSAIQWIDHAIEESIDHIVYLTVLKRKLAAMNRRGVE